MSEPTRTVHAIVAGVLGDDTIDTTLSFVDLGGSSLGAVRVASRIERELGLRVDPQMLLSRGSVAAFAADIAGTATPPRTATPPDTATPDLRTAPVSLAQQWALDKGRRDRAAPAMKFQVAYQLDGSLDPDALAAAFAAVGDHHPMLRAHFGRSDDRDTVEIADEPLRLTIDRLPEAPTPAAAVARLNRFAAQPFPTDSGARVRGLLVTAPPDRHHVVFSFDRRAVDGWSLSVVLEDLATAYRALATGRPVELPPAGSFLAHATSDRSSAAERIARAADFWRSQVPADERDFPLVLPGHRGDGPLSGPQELNRDLPADVADAIAATRRATGHTAFVVVTAAAAAALSGLTGRDRVRISASTANRDAADHARTVGWFSHSLLPVFDAKAHRDGPALMAHVADRLAAWRRHGDLPAGYVRAAVWPGPGPAVVDTGVYLACEDSWSAPFVLPDVRVREILLEDRADGRGIQIYLSRGPAGWNLRAFHHTSEYPGETVEHLVTELFGALRRFGRAVS